MTVYLTAPVDISAAYRNVPPGSIHLESRHFDAHGLRWIVGDAAYDALVDADVIVEIP